MDAHSCRTPLLSSEPLVSERISTPLPQAQVKCGEHHSYSTYFVLSTEANTPDRNARLFLSMKRR